MTTSVEERAGVSMENMKISADKVCLSLDYSGKEITINIVEAQNGGKAKPGRNIVVRVNESDLSINLNLLSDFISRFRGEGTKR
jgi:hypothetical protein